MEIYALQAVIYKIQTMADGGFRVTLDFSQKDAEAIADLMRRKVKGRGTCRVVFVEPESPAVRSLDPGSLEPNAHQDAPDENSS